jgi:hypothetical protein
MSESTHPVSVGGVAALAVPDEHVAAPVPAAKQTMRRMRIAKATMGRMGRFMIVISY